MCACVRACVRACVCACFEIQLHHQSGFCIVGVFMIRMCRQERTVRAVSKLAGYMISYVFHTVHTIRLGVACIKGSPEPEQVD